MQSRLDPLDHLDNITASVLIYAGESQGGQLPTRRVTLGVRRRCCGPLLLSRLFSPSAFTGTADKVCPIEHVRTAMSTLGPRRVASLHPWPKIVGSREPFPQQQG